MAVTYFAMKNADMARFGCERGWKIGRPMRRRTAKQAVVGGVLNASLCACVCVCIICWPHTYE